MPTVDSVQEFKVQTNSFTAQCGLSTGNVVNMISKSGTVQTGSSAEHHLDSKFRLKVNRLI